MSILRALTSRLATIKKEYIAHIMPQQAILPALPKRYQIEVVNYCTLHCPTCSSLRLGDIEKKWMTKETFIRIADQIPEYSYVYLTNWGEPFLNPDIIDIIKEGKKRNFTLRIDSNFNFDPKLCTAIVDSGLDILMASLDGGTQEGYEKFRKGGDFSLARENFSTIARIKHERGNNSLQLIWKFIVNRYNEHEMDIAKNIVNKLPGNIPILFHPIGLRQEKVEWDQYQGETLDTMKKEWLPKNKKYIMPFFLQKNPQAVVAASRCPRLWKQMTISVNLDVTPCCHTYKPEHIFGNLNQTSLLEIWNNHHYQTSRNFFTDPEYSSCTTVCARCPNYIRRKENTMFMRHVMFFYWLIRALRDFFTAPQRTIPT